MRYSLFLLSFFTDIHHYILLPIKKVLTIELVAGNKRYYFIVMRGRTRDVKFIEG